MSNHKPQTNETAATDKRSLALPIVIAIISAIAFLDANFMLKNWAMASTVNHTIDHALIFVSGTVFGSALYSLLRRRR